MRFVFVLALILGSTSAMAGGIVGKWKEQTITCSDGINSVTDLNEYTFTAQNTYEMVLPNQAIPECIIHIQGTYQISGNQLTLTPEAYQNKCTVNHIPDPLTVAVELNGDQLILHKYGIFTSDLCEHGGFPLNMVFSRVH